MKISFILVLFFMVVNSCADSLINLSTNISDTDIYINNKKVAKSSKNINETISFDLKKGDYNITAIKSIDEHLRYYGEKKIFVLSSNTKQRVHINLQKVMFSKFIDWDKVIGGKKSEYAISVINTNDKNILVLAHTRSYNNKNSLILLKLSEKGKLIWQKIYKNINQAFANKLVKTDDNNFIILANTIKNKRYYRRYNKQKGMKEV